MTPVVERLRVVVVCLVLTAGVVAQDAGRVVADTKLDLTVDPLALMGRSLHLWDPQGGAGELGDQAYGYLFPMGPLMALMRAIGIPDWTAQRLWQSLVLCTALLGLRALAQRLELGTPGTRLLAGLAYALAARPVSQLGAISAEVWPYALAPWVLVPLVTAARGGSPRRAAALSGLAVLLAGGVNATATLAVLPLAILWLLVQPPSPARRRLALWWGAAVVCATAWWMGPLLLLGRYSPPFLDVIESASVTTRLNGIWSTLTGNDLWLQYLAFGPPARPAGFLLVTTPGLVLCSTALAALGVVALGRSSTPHRGFLTGGVLLGLLLVGAGHAGHLSGPLVPLERQLLDGPLAAFRNTHKYDLVLRVPLVLGLAHLAATARRPRPTRLPLRRPVALLAALAVVGAASPAFSRLEPIGSWAAVPGYWREVATFLRQGSPGPAPPRALVIPAAGRGQYGWGAPGDEPLQALARTPWAVRDAVPLGGPGVTRVLDVVEQVLRSGRGSPALAAFLSRAGIRYLVVRNDLDSVAADAVRPLVLHAALAASPGLTKVAGFGPPVGAGFATGLRVYDAELSPTYDSVEVFEVAGPVGAVATWPRAGTQRVSGGPESLLPLLEQGVLTATGATRLAGEAALPGEQDELRTITDGYRKRELDIGRAADAASATLGAGTGARGDRPVHDYLPVPLAHSATTAVLSGMLSVTASSAASDADALVVRGPDHNPTAAFDGDGATTWVTGGLNPRGQWVEARFVSRLLTAVELTAPVVDGTVAPIRVRVATDAAVRDVTLLAGLTRVEVEGVTGRVRITVLDVAGGSSLGVTALEARLLTPTGPFVAQRGLRIADDAAEVTGGRPADPRVAIVFSAGRRDRPGCLPVGDRPVCAAALPLGDEDDPAIDRTLALDRGALLGMAVTGRARPGAALDELLQQGQPVTVTASSTAVLDPGQRPAAVLDREVRTSWLASALDPRPTLFLHLAAPRRIEGVRVVVDPYLAASRPTSVAVRVDGGPVRFATLTVSGEARMPGVTGTRVEVWFPDVQRRLSSRWDGLVEQLPVGVTELGLLGPGPDVRQVLDRAKRVVVPCGQGPVLAVDGVVRVAVRVETTLGALMDGGAVGLPVCTGGLALAAGQHRLRIERTSTVQVTGLTLVDLARPAPAQGTSRVARVVRWGSTRRVLDVNAGDASWLVVHEAFNRGWQARLDGRRLVAARLDGWQQGFVLPAGGAGRVELVFAPDRPYRLALLLGAALALLLVLAAAGRSRHVQRLPDPARRRRGWGFVGAGLAAGAVLVLGGAPGAAALLVAALAARWDRRVPAWLAGAGVVAAGSLVALQPWPQPALLGAPVQALCLLAVASLAVSLWPVPAAPSESSSDPGSSGASPAARRRADSPTPRGE